MLADCYWINVSDNPLSFFMDGLVRYNVAAFDYLFLRPEEITRGLPSGLLHCTQALVQLYLQGYPSRTSDEHRRLIHALGCSGLLDSSSEPGALILTQDGVAVLHAAGLT